MALPDFIFYMFSSILAMSALMVIFVRNPAHSILFLVICFFSAAALFVLMGAEFVAFAFMIVGAGAIAALLMFVVMGLDIDFGEARRGVLKYLLMGVLAGAILLVQLVAAIDDWNMADPSTSMPPLTDIENTYALGQVLFTHYMYPFQVSGLILLIALMGAVTLVLKERKDICHRKERVEHNSKDVLEIKRVKSGEGVK